MKKMLLGLLIAALLTAAGLIAAVCICAQRERPVKASDCIIVLGARVWPDGRMSNSLLYRCQSALKAWQNGTAENIIACGARGGDEPEEEARVMKAYFVANGVPEAQVIAEDRSFNTEQNLENAARIMAEKGWNTAAVVTNDYHVERALWLAKDAGIDACGISARPPSTAGAWLLSRIREPISWVLYGLRKVLPR